jgi:hypothetical protein
MVRKVVEATSNTTLLTTALPLLIREHKPPPAHPGAQVLDQRPQGSTVDLQHWSNVSPQPVLRRSGGAAAWVIQEDAELGLKLAGEVC